LKDKNAAKLNGSALIDEDYLAEQCGWKPEDFAKYRCEPDRGYYMGVTAVVCIVT